MRSAAVSDERLELNYVMKVPTICFHRFYLHDLLQIEICEMLWYLMWIVKLTCQKCRNYKNISQLFETYRLWCVMLCEQLLRTVSTASFTARKHCVGKYLNFLERFVPVAWVTVYTISSAVRKTFEGLTENLFGSVPNHH